MAKLSNFLQPLCFGFVLLCCGMNVLLADPCGVAPTGINCDATLARKALEERTFVFIDSSGVGYSCICNSGGWESSWTETCNAGASGSAIAESTDKK